MNKSQILILSGMVIVMGSVAGLQFLSSPTPHTEVTAVDIMLPKEDLVSLEAQYAVVSTASLASWGMTAKTTALIVGQVQYKTDLGAAKILQTRDTIQVTLPETVITDPVIDVKDIQIFEDDSLLRLSDDNVTRLRKQATETGRQQIKLKALPALSLARAQAVQTVKRMLSGSGKSVIVQ